MHINTEIQVHPLQTPPPLYWGGGKLGVTNILTFLQHRWEDSGQNVWSLTTVRYWTSYRFWSSAAFLIQGIFSFFSMAFQAASIAFCAFFRSFCEEQQFKFMVSKKECSGSSSTLEKLCKASQSVQICLTWSVLGQWDFALCHRNV